MEKNETKRPLNRFDMFLSKMFLGLPLEGELASCLNATDPKIKELFISKSGDYLQMITLNHQCYLGKMIESAESLASLELLEVHVFSILHKMAPSFKTEAHPLILFPIQDHP